MIHFVQCSIFSVSPDQNPNFFPKKSRCGMNRSATASLHSATPKKNVSCFLDLAGVKFFLKMERTFFFGVLPSKYSGSVAEQCGLGFAKTIFWGKGFGKTSTDLDFASGGGGVWGGILRLLHPFSFGEIRGEQKTKYKFYFYIVPLTF